jgi:Tfp pilus assembly protein PilF
MKKPVQFLYAMGLAASLAMGAASAAKSGNAESLLASGTQLLQQGKLEPAQKAYEAAVKADPRSVDAKMKLAGVYIAQNNFTAATRTYQQVIGLDPTNAKAFIGLGIAYLHSGDKALTRAALEEALRLEPQRKEQLTPILSMLDESAKPPK